MSRGPTAPAPSRLRQPAELPFSVFTVVLDLAVVVGIVRAAPELATPDGSPA